MCNRQQKAGPGGSSRILRKRHPDLLRRYWKGVLWSPSYFAASCGGAPLSIIKQYTSRAAGAAAFCKRRSFSYVRKPAP
jgi:REP element-mobilizing transposase RayT